MTTTSAISTLAEHGYQVTQTTNHFEVTGGGKTEIISEQQLVDMARGIENPPANPEPLIKPIPWMVAMVEELHNEELGI